MSLLYCRAKPARCRCGENGAVSIAIRGTPTNRLWDLAQVSGI
jgi:hypothetical protein